MTKEILLPLHDSDANRVIIRGIPEADLVVMLRATGILEFWCLKGRTSAWSFDLKSVLNHSVKASFYNTTLDYELDGRSSMKIAMCCKSKRG